MRSLFLRIFVSFWIAMGLILAGGIVVTATLVWRNLEALESIDASQLAAAATEALRSGGPAKLQQWVADTEAANTGLSIYILDQRGRDLLARPLPGWLHERVERTVAARGRFGENHRERHEGAEDSMDRTPLAREHDLHFAPEIVTAQGSGYTMVFATSGPSPLALLGRYEASIVLLGLALLVSGLVSWWLARFFSAPIARLQTSARALAAGRFDARVGGKMARRRDELGVLARDFDSMAERLRALVESREMLLRDLSHELRSPLARLRVATELARRGGAELPNQLDRIERDTERLDSLIGQMLQLSRLHNAEPTQARERVDLAQLVAEIVEDARLEAVAANKSVSWSEGPQVQVEGDPELLRRGMENIIRNAVRFTPAGSSVEISLVAAGGSAILTVRDHGSGVPDTDLERIFEPFYRVSTARERDSGGTGLGLAITARVAAVHGGTVRAANCPDGGLRIDFTVPLLGSAASRA